MTVDRLEEILRQEVEVSQALLHVLEQEQQAIVRMNLEQLDALVVQEHDLLRSVQRLEKDRIKFLEAALPTSRRKQGQGIESPPALRELVKLLDSADAERIARLGNALRQEVESILNTNRRIKILLNHSLRFVRESVDMLTEGHTKQLIDQKM